MKWKTVKLGTLCKLVNGKAFKPSDWSEDGIRIVRIQNLNDPTKDYNHWAGPLDKQVLIDSGDLLLAWSGTPGTSFGAHIWNNGKAILNQHIFRVDLHGGVIDPEWAKMSINYKLYSLIDQAHGGVGLQHVTKPMVQSLDISLPPLHIQKEIVAILEKADAARGKRHQAKLLTEQFIQSAFLEMFGDPVTNPKGWEIVELGSLLTFLTSGSRGWAKYYTERGDKFLRIQNVGRGRLLLDDIAYVSAPDGAEARRTRVKENDVLLSITADLGRTCVIPKDFGIAYINQHLSILRTKDIHPVYLSAFLASEGGASQIRRLDRQGVKSGLNFNDVKSLKILKPEKSVQEKYVSLIERIESLRVMQKESEKELENLFNSLMQSAFKGELVR